MKKTAIILTLLLSVGLWAQNITKVEYFIDNDNGYGLNTYEMVTGGNDIVFNKTIDINETRDGIHTLYVRAMDDENRWSTTLHSHFITIDPNNWRIDTLEYYIDDDPGIGKGTKVKISNKSKLSLNFNVDLSSYNEGLHTITLRAKNSLGVWSRLYIYNFEIQEGLSVTDIEKMNILIYPSPTTGNFTINLKNTSDARVVITDLSGRVISDKKYSKIQIITGRINGNNGIYIVHVLTELNNRQIFKIEKL